MIWLYNSRVISILVVVFLHSAAAAVLGYNIGTSYWWIGNIYDSMTRWCVPVFVMISGALLLDPLKKESLHDFYLKRMSKILIPIIFWSLFYSLWSCLKAILIGREIIIIDLFKNIVSGKPYYHMWFLYMIILLYLFTPFFRKIITHSSRYELNIFVALTVLLSALSPIKNIFFPSNYSPFIYWFLSYIPYFFIGYLIRCDSNSYSRKILWLVLSVSIIVTSLGSYFLANKTDLTTGLYFYNYLSVTVIPMSISIMYLLKSWVKPIVNNNISKLLSALTLGVYLIHPILLDIFRFIGISADYLNPVWSVPCITILASSISFFIAYVISRIKYLKRII